LERKLGASSIEEICLRKALSDAHAESERLKQRRRTYTRSIRHGENLLKLALVDHKRTINFLTQEVE
jgi:hypothetical protein